MTLYNPFMPYRFLNPRASGLVVFKGNDGASAEQVDASVQAGTTAVNENTNARAAEAAVVGEELKTNQGTMLNNQDDLKTGQSDIRRDIANIPQTTVVSQTVDTSGIENRIGSLEGTTSSGFADVGGRLDTVNNTLGDVQGSVDTGFASMNQNFNDITEGQTGIQNTLTDVSGNMAERFDTVDNTLDTGFTGVNENINTQFDTQNQNLTDMSANILGGQTNLQSYLEGMSDRNDTYYGGLAEGQSNIMGEVGGLQTGLASFRDAYDANTTLANQTRAELLDTVSGGFNRTREAIADNFGDTQRDIASVSSQIDQQGRQEQAGEQSIQRDFTAAIRELSAGFEAGTQDQAAAQQDVINRIDTVKQVLATQSENLPEDIRRQYTQLATSFDENGRLIRESVDAQGLVTRRAMDNQSNVLLAQFNQQGDMLGQSMFNMNALLKQMDQLGYTGMGRQPGDLAPQQLVNRRAAIDSGLMQRQDPYFNTFG
jgi:hypothetical protein